MAKLTRAEIERIASHVIGAATENAEAEIGLGADKYTARCEAYTRAVHCIGESLLCSKECANYGAPRALTAAESKSIVTANRLYPF